MRQYQELTEHNKQCVVLKRDYTTWTLGTGWGSDDGIIQNHFQYFEMIDYRDVISCSCESRGKKGREEIDARVTSLSRIC